MLVTRYPNGRAVTLAPWRGLEPLTNRFDRLLAETMENVGPANGANWAPAVDIVETGDALLIQVDVPGMRVEDIDIELDSNVLTISGERAPAELAQGERRIVTGRSFGTFQRSFPLPRTVDPNGISARLDDGVLTVRLEKAAEAQSRKIEVQTSA